MKNIFVLFLLLIVVSTQAQNKMLTMEDAMVKNRSTLAAGNLRQLQFIYGTEDYVYLSNSGYVRGSAKKGGAGVNEQSFLTLGELNSKFRSAGRDTFTAMPAIRFNESPDWVMTVKGEKIALNPAKNTVKVLVPKDLLSKEIKEESSAGFISYINDHNLFVSTGKENHQVTKDGSSNIVYGTSVHREEFGITKGMFWSNDGKKLAFYRMDQSMVTDYPIIDWTKTPAEAVNIKYPMAGDKSHHVKVGIFNPMNHQLIYLQTGEPAEQYLTNIAWSPDNKYVFIAVLNRGQDHLKLNQYDAVSGAFVKTLFEEKDEKYVEPQHPMLFLKSNPNQFIWQSNRDGWNHLYLYNLDGKLLQQLTRGEWEVTEVKGFDGSGEHLFYMSTKESPITKHAYKLNLKTGVSTPLTSLYGMHNVSFSTSGNSMLDIYSNATTPREIIYKPTTATTPGSSIYKATHPLEAYTLGEMSVFTIPNQDGTPLYSRMFKPSNFDSTQQYPVIVYWYGGPHNQMVTSGFNGGAGDYWFQYLAQRGYIVFSLDPRGTDNRGKAFSQAMFRKAGEVQKLDLMSGVKYLASLPYVDTSRMGLFGWSYGGYMTIDFMLTYPGVFKAGVAGGPVTDWRLYEIMYGERYMDTPQENPEGYAATDLSKRIDQLKGKLLVIHGLQDPVVVQQHSVKLVRAAIDKNVVVDYSIYPGHEHNVIGKDRAHLYRAVTEYLFKHLEGDTIE